MRECRIIRSCVIDRNLVCSFVSTVAATRTTATATATQQGAQGGNVSRRNDNACNNDGAFHAERSIRETGWSANEK